jgi:hypothetical protein
MWSPDLTTAVEKFKGGRAPSSLILVAPMQCLEFRRVSTKTPPLEDLSGCKRGKKEPN